MNRTILFSIAFFTITICSGYEVVLKDGKTVTGKLISETETTIVLKDASGVLVNFHKTDVDLEKTSERNSKEVKKTDKKGRVYKKDDLEKMPELSVAGSEQEPEPEEEEAFETETVKEKESEQEQESVEESWKQETRRLGIALREAEARYQQLNEECTTITTAWSGTVEQLAEQQRMACLRVDAARKELEELQKEFDDFTEQARKKGIPPGWVDPLRVDQ